MYQHLSAKSGRQVLAQAGNFLDLPARRAGNVFHFVSMADVNTVVKAITEDTNETFTVFARKQQNAIFLKCIRIILAYPPVTRAFYMHAYGSPVPASTCMRLPRSCPART